MLIGQNLQLTTRLFRLSDVMQVARVSMKCEQKVPSPLTFVEYDHRLI